ncbi:MAG: hypothetical protein WBH47_13750 [Streptosporangiaceae bacterium]
MSALRSALAAIGNAEALPVPTPPGDLASRYVAGSAAGLGMTEASRRALTEAEIAGLVSAEIAERRAAAARSEQAGHAGRAGRLQREADTLAAVVSGDPAGAADG